MDIGAPSTWRSNTIRTAQASGDWNTVVQKHRTVFLCYVYSVGYVDISRTAELNLNEHFQHSAERELNECRSTYQTLGQMGVTFVAASEPHDAEFRMREARYIPHSPYWSIYPSPCSFDWTHVLSLGISSRAAVSIESATCISSGSTGGKDGRTAYLEVLDLIAGGIAKRVLGSQKWKTALKAEGDAFVGALQSLPELTSDEKPEFQDESRFWRPSSPETLLKNERQQAKEYEALRNQKIDWGQVAGALVSASARVANQYAVDPGSFKDGTAAVKINTQYALERAGLDSNTASAVVNPGKVNATPGEATAQTTRAPLRQRRDLDAECAGERVWRGAGTDVQAMMTCMRACVAEGGERQQVCQVLAGMNSSGPGLCSPCNGTFTSLAKASTAPSTTCRASSSLVLSSGYPPNERAARDSFEINANEFCSSGTGTVAHDSRVQCSEANALGSSVWKCSGSVDCSARKKGCNSSD
ncbi:MAG: hypothetical protein Q8L48_11795 [Archangium sp.]|nr:hypothetical protein [Archangium sp.]